jgi:hypothetical protein
LLDGFESGKTSLSKENVTSIRNAVMSLQKGLEKIEIGLDGMKSVFNKPLTPDDAIVAFKEYVDGISKGRERDNIRIILK